MNDIQPITLPGIDPRRPLVIAGPCSAETEEQVLGTARSLMVQARVPSAMGAVSRMAEAKKLANEIQKSIIQQLLPVSGPGRHSP